MEENEVSKLTKYFEELIDNINDSLHKRILQAALESSNPLIEMEAELSKYRSLNLSKDELEWCLGNTAAKVFKI